MRQKTFNTGLRHEETFSILAIGTGLLIASSFLPKSPVSQEKQNNVQRQVRAVISAEDGDRESILQNSLRETNK